MSARTPLAKQVGKRLSNDTADRAMDAVGAEGWAVLKAGLSSVPLGLRKDLAF